MRSTHGFIAGALVTSLAALLPACGGGNASGSGSSTQQQGSEPIQPPPPPMETAAEAGELDRLFVDLAAKNVCELLRGDFLALRSSEGGGETPGTAPAIGRLWVEQCSASQPSEDEVTLELSGRGWQWVDKESSAAGATFSVSQYVRLHTDLSMTGNIDVAYHQEDPVVTIWYSPTEPVDATVRPIGDVDVESQGLWSSVVGGVALLVGSSPSSRAESRVRERGSNRFEARLSHGFTVAYDLCTGQRYTTVRRLEEGEIPGHPMDAQGRVYKDNVRVTLYPGGIDADGPYKTDDGPVNVEVRMEQGPGVEAKLVCISDLRRTVDAFAESAEELPRIEAKGEAVVMSGQSSTFQASPESCELGLLFTPLGTAEEPVVFSYMVWHEGAEREPVVECTDEQIREVDSALPEAQTDGNPGEEGSGDGGN